MRLDEMNKIKQKLEIETRSVIELTYAVLGCTGWLFPLLPDVTEDGCHFRLISHTTPKTLHYQRYGIEHAREASKEIEELDL